MGGLRKFNMYNDSRKAQYNSFAHHRAQLLFTKLVPDKGDGDPWLATARKGSEGQDQSKALRDRVIAGLLGFTPAALTAAH